MCNRLTKLSVALWYTLFFSFKFHNTSQWILSEMHDTSLFDTPDWALQEIDYLSSIQECMVAFSFIKSIAAQENMPLMQVQFLFFSLVTNGCPKTADLVVRVKLGKPRLSAKITAVPMIRSVKSRTESEIVMVSTATILFGVRGWCCQNITIPTFRGYNAFVYIPLLLIVSPHTC